MTPLAIWVTLAPPVDPGAPSGLSTTLAVVLALITAGTLNIALETFKYFKGGQRRKDRAEAAEASMKVATDTQQAPLIRETLALGNFDKAIAIQQQVINGLNAQRDRDIKMHEQEIRMHEQEVLGYLREIKELRESVASRDRRIDELESELEQIRERMDKCQEIITELRADHDAEVKTRAAEKATR